MRRRPVAARPTAGMRWLSAVWEAAGRLYHRNARIITRRTRSRLSDHVSVSSERMTSPPPASLYSLSGKRLSAKASVSCSPPLSYPEYTKRPFRVRSVATAEIR